MVKNSESVNILNVQNVIGSLGKLYISFLKNPVSCRAFSYILMEPSRPWESVGMVVAGGGGNSSHIHSKLLFRTY